jgi:integrase
LEAIGCEDIVIDFAKTVADPWEIALRDFWDEKCPAVVYAPASVNKYRQGLTWLRRAARSPDELDRSAVLQMMKRAKDDNIQNETINSVMNPMFAICEWLVAQQRMATNPIDKKKLRLRIKNPRMRQDKTISNDDLVQILQRADQEFIHSRCDQERWLSARLRALLYLVCFTGFRKSEALRLRRSRYDGQTLSVLGEDHAHRQAKTMSSERRVPIPDGARLRLNEWLAVLDKSGEHQWIFPGIRKDSPWVHGTSGTRALERIQQLAERAQVSQHVTLHNLRHTFATTAIHSAGFTAAQLALVMGHSSTYTQSVYVHHHSAMVGLMNRITFAADDRPRDSVGMSPVG